MFVDIIGSTALSEKLAAEPTFSLLRGFYNRMGGAVFAAICSVDKYLGDGLMANFGAPEKGDQDASNSIRCALGMQQSINDLNKLRAADGELEISIAIGIHFGPVLIGNNGNKQRLEFATLGDTVNGAARLEHLARPLEALVVISDDLVEAVKAEGGEELLADFVRLGEETLRGRGRAVWKQE